MFLSLVRPDRISSPMTSRAAVTDLRPWLLLSGACSASAPAQATAALKVRRRCARSSGRHPMRFAEPLLEGRLVRATSDFSPISILPRASGSPPIAPIRAPCSVSRPPAAGCCLSRSTNPERKLRFSWEFVEAAVGGEPPQLVGINTARPNALVAEALRGRRPARPSSATSASGRRSDTAATAGSTSCSKRKAGRPAISKSRTALHASARARRIPGLRRGAFRQAPRELADMVAAGARAALVYVIQMEADRFDVARDIDPGLRRGVRGGARRRRRILCLRVSRDAGRDHDCRGGGHRPQLLDAWRRPARDE